MQDFLDLYYQACSVLLKEQDFYDLMYAYLRRANYNNVHVAEIFFDPQTHTERGVPFSVVINGFHQALVDGYHDFSIKGSLILCFLRHLPEDKHFETLQEARPHLNKILGVGLDSGEKGNPPELFERVFAEARSLGLKVVAHAGEEGGPDYVRGALDCLKVTRIDHGIQSLFDDALVQRLRDEGIPLTVCPLSNKKLQVDSRYFGGKNQTKELLSRGLTVTINSDDPAYFGGYITDNFKMAARETGLTIQDVHHICRNAFNASFLSAVEKEHYMRLLDQFNIYTGMAPPSKTITFFGSRAPLPGSPDYELARATGKLFADKGYHIITGGYNGIMKGAVHGANEVGGTAVGYIAPRVFRNRPMQGNEYLTKNVTSRTFSERTAKLVESSHYLVAFPGKLGTLVEILLSCSAQFGASIGKYPLQKIFVHRKHFEGLIENLMETLDVAKDEQHILYFDTPEELLEAVERDYKERQKVAIF